MFDEEWNFIKDILFTHNNWDIRTLYWMQNEYTNNKAWMFPGFGADGRVSVKLDTSITLTHQEIVEQLASLWNQEAARLYTCIARVTETSGKVPSAVTFSLREIVQYIVDTIEVSEVITNKLSKDYYFGNAGMKVSKVVKNIIKELMTEDILDIGKQLVPPAQHMYIRKVVKNTDTDGLEKIVHEVNQIYSKLIELLKNGGQTLVISVNPLDMMFASDFVSGWTSCYRMLATPGIHAEAPMSFTCDANTAIAYVTEKKADSTITGVDGATAPIKSWRAFVHFSPQEESAINVWVGRQYKERNPFVTSHLKPLIQQIVANIYGYREELEEEQELDAPVHLRNKAYGYEDTCTLAYYKDYLTAPIAGSDILFCVHCGVHPITHKSELRCKYCVFAHCKKCGKRFRMKQLYKADNGVFCEECYHDGAVNRCSRCGRFAEVNTMTITEYGYICKNCKERGKTAKVTCNRCGVITPIESITRISSTQLVCPECLEKVKKEREEV